MTLMGQKRNANEPRKPMKRSPLLRTGRIARKPTTEADKAYEAFMASYRGLPSLISGRTKSKFLRDDRGRLLKTEAHHVLPRSVFPEYKMCHWNIAVLTREEHSWAEDNPVAFMKWLHDEHPLMWKVIQEHNHHRKDTNNG